MDAIRLHSDGTLSSEAPFAGLLRMRLELDGDVTLRSFFRLLKRNPLARELVPGLGDALAEAEACPASGCRYPGLEALRLGKRVELTGFPGTPRVDVYLAVEGVGDELPELRFFRLRDMLDTPLQTGTARHVLLGETATALDAETSFTVFDLLEGMVRMMDTEDDFTGPINIGNPNEFPVLELAERVIRMTGSTSKIVFKPLPTDDPKQRQPDIKLAKEKLGWQPTVELEDGLKRMIEYFKNV